MPEGNLDERARNFQAKLQAVPVVPGTHEPERYAFAHGPRRLGRIQLHFIHP